MKVIKTNQIDGLRCILKYQPDITELKDNRKYTLLHEVSLIGNAKALEVLLETSAPHINDKNDCGSTALLYASEVGHKDCVKVLLHHNAAVNSKIKMDTLH